MVKRSHINKDWTGETPVAREVLRSYAIQTGTTYIVCRQGIVLHWVDLRSVFELFVWEPVFEGGGWRNKPWSWQEAPDELLKATLAEALQVAHKADTTGRT